MQIFLALWCLGVSSLNNDIENRIQRFINFFFTDIVPTDKEEEAFKDLDIAILVGSMPRKDGMERKDLLKANVAIFKSQGAALEKYAKKTVKVDTHTYLYYSAAERIFFFFCSVFLTYRSFLSVSVFVLCCVRLYFNVFFSGAGCGKPCQH